MRQIQLFLLHVNLSALFTGLFLSSLLLSVGLVQSYEWSANTKNWIFISIIGGCFLAVFGLAKLRRIVTLRFERELLEKSSTTEIGSVVPLETLRDGSRRKVVFDEYNAGNPPGVYQRWMVLNPLVWIMIYYFAIACTLDDALRKHGVAYETSLVSRESYSDTVSVKGPVTATNNFENLKFKYIVNGQSYFATSSNPQSPGDQADAKPSKIWAIPEHPEFHEPIGDDRGSKQQTDFYIALLCFAANLYFEFAIWWVPLLHRRLAEIGIPVTAQVRTLQYDLSLSAGHTGDVSELKTIIELNRDDKARLKEFKLSAPQYKKLQVGAQELILYDPRFAENMVLYRFCKYKIVG